MGSVSHLANH